MARKQALRDLQTRLAERMLEARTQTRGRAWLAVECGRHGFLIPLQEAGEIFSAASLVPLPYAQPWCLGVANLRGQLHAVADLGAFLGLHAPLQAGQALRDQAQLLAFNPNLEINAALLVDRLAGLRNEAQMAPAEVPLQAGQVHADKTHGEAEASPAAAPRRPTFAGEQLRDADGRLWQALSLSALARHAAFLRVAA